jgi:hypothetical protein
MSRRRAPAVTAVVVGLLAYCGTIAVVLTIGRAAGAGAGLGLVFGAHLLGAVAAVIAVGAVLHRSPPP